MAKRSQVIVDETITVKDSNGNVAVTSPEDSIFWDTIKMANFRFAMRQFDNGSEQGTALSWRGLVCKLLTLRESDKQVFVTVFENSGQKYNITLRKRIVLSDSGIGYSLCSLLEHLALKQPNGVFVRIDIRDTLEIPQVLDLLRQRFPKPNKS